MEAFSSEVFTLISFAFVDCALVSHPWVHCQDQFHEVFPLCFPIRALYFEGMFQSLCYSKLNFLIQYQFPISFFTCGYKVFLTPFVEETLFPALYSWHACGGSVDHICCVFTSRLLFCSIPLCLCLWQYHARTHKHVFAGISRNWNTPTLLVGVQDSAATMENCIEVLTDIENRLMGLGRGEERVRCMERVTRKLTLPYVK